MKLQGKGMMNTFWLEGVQESVEGQHDYGNRNTLLPGNKDDSHENTKIN